MCCSTQVILVSAAAELGYIKRTGYHGAQTPEDPYYFVHTISWFISVRVGYITETHLMLYSKAPTTLN